MGYISYFLSTESFLVYFHPTFCPGNQKITNFAPEKSVEKFGCLQPLKKNAKTATFPHLCFYGF